MAQFPERASQVKNPSAVKNPPADAGATGDAGSTHGSRRSMEEEFVTHSNILSWEIPWTEEPGRLQSTGSDTTELTRKGKRFPERITFPHCPALLL